LSTTYINLNPKLRITNILGVEEYDHVIAYKEDSEGLKSYVSELHVDFNEITRVCMTDNFREALHLNLIQVMLLFNDKSKYKFNKVIQKEIDISDEVHFLATGKHIKNCGCCLDNGLLPNGFELNDLIAKKPVISDGCGCGTNRIK